MSTQRKTNFALIFVLILTTSCGTDDTDGEAAEQVEAESSLVEAAKPRHPLAGLNIDGLLPTVDVQDSPTGQRYALSDWGDDDGVRSSAHSTLIELKRDFDVPADLPLPSREPPAPPPVISDRLELLLSSSEDDTLTVIVHTHRADYPSIQAALRRAAAEGRTTLAEKAVDHAVAIDEKELAIRESQQSLIGQIEQLGGTATSCGRLNCLIAELTPATVRGLATNPLVRRLEANHQLEAGSLNGTEVRQGTQVFQYMQECIGTCSNLTWPTYDGENASNSNWDITAAIFEVGTFHSGHPGFLEAGGGADRIRGQWECDSGGCTTGSWSANDSGFQNHATAVAGIVIGDLHDGQDGSHTSFAERELRSGYAGEARAYLYQTKLLAGRLSALDHVLGRAPTPHVLNESTWQTSGPYPCNGMDSLSINTNELYEDGVLPIRIGGNPGHSNSSDCTVSPGADAIGAFTVGGHTTSWSSDDETDVRSGTDFSSTPRGGVSYADGRNRSIIDITAPACRTNMFRGNASNLYGYSACGTSFAGPTVASAAIAHVDHYRNNISTLIDEPGVLFANLLLMGDRESESGVKMIGRFDHLWGAGRLKMRRLDATGLDTPYTYRVLNTCIASGESLYTPEFTTYSDSDVVKGVLNWYDRRHEDGTAIDEVYLYLERETSPGVWQTYGSSSDTFDNKQRVFRDITSLGTTTWRWRFYGGSVTYDESICGTNHMLINFAMFAEDSDRDDADGVPEADDVDTED